MRVALVTYSTKPRGGVVHTLALAEALAGLGVDVHVWTLGRDGDGGFFRPVAPEVTLHVVRFPPREGEPVGARILRSISVLGHAFATERDSYDVVHAQDCISANAVGDCVRTVHHLDRFSTPELAACHERAIVQPSAHVCVSASVATELEQGWGIRAVVIPNGVDADRFARTDPADRRVWRDRFGRYLLAVGGIEPRKGTIELLRAWAALRQRTETADVALVLAGGETLFDYRDYRAQFDATAAELGVTPAFLGPVEHDRLPSLVAGCAVFGFFSAAEGFGLAAMEALAADRPVVVRDLPVLREVFGDQVRYAADEEGLVDALAEAIDGGPCPGGPEFAATHRWEAAARAHLDLYRSLTGAGS